MATWWLEVGMESSDRDTNQVQSKLASCHISMAWLRASYEHGARRTQVNCGGSRGHIVAKFGAIIWLAGINYGRFSLASLVLCAVLVLFRCVCVCVCVCGYGLFWEYWFPFVI